MNLKPHPKKVLVLYHEDVALRFPSHYRLPFFEYLPRYGYNIFFICFHSGVDTVIQEGQTILIPRLRFRGAVGTLKDCLKTKKYLRVAIHKACLDHLAPVFVITFNNPIAMQEGHLLAKSVGAKHIIHLGHLFCEAKIRAPGLLEKMKGYSAIVFRNRMMQRADQVWLMSNEMRRYFRGKIDDNKLKVWPSAVSTKLRFQGHRCRHFQIRKELGFGRGDRVLIYVGQLSRRRDLAFVLRAFRLVLSEIDNVKLLFVGYSRESEDLRILKRKAQEIGIARHVYFHPPVPEDDLHWYTSLADIGLSPFKPTFVLRHNSPLKLLEYLRVGTPVVATDIPDQRKILQDSGAGYLTDWDEGRFAAAITKLLLKSPDELAVIGRKGMNWVKENREIQTLTEGVVWWLKELECADGRSIQNGTVRQSLRQVKD